MTHFERTLTMNADAERVFAYVSDLNNFPNFLPTLAGAEKLDGDKVRVWGESHGHPYDQECFFRVDAAQHRIDWGVPDEKQYRGHMVVHGGDTTRTLSELTIGLQFNDPAVEQRGERILDGIQAALEAVREQVAARAAAQTERGRFTP